MSVTAAIYQKWTDDILRTAVWSASVAPQSSYSLTTLGAHDPGQRVRWGVKTVTLHATLAAAAQGDIVVIPMYNLDAGATVLTITNGAGVNQVVTIPALQADSLPPTIVVDLTSFSTLQRTSTTWNFVISGNSANVILGGAVMVYGPKRTFATPLVGGNFAIEYQERELHHKQEDTNEYGTRYIVDYETATRWVEVTLRVLATGVTSVRDWWRAGHGGALPSFFWPDPTVSDGYFGTWQDTFEIQHQTADYHPVGLTFQALSKGQPLV